MFKIILKLCKKYNEMQLLKSKKAHEILVAVMLTLSICCSIFNITKFEQYIIIFAHIRAIDIFVHNMCVAFFDKYKEENGKCKVIENISSYERIFMLNILVIFELVMWLKFVDIRLLYLSLFPTLYLVIKSTDKLFEKEIIK